MRVVIFSYLVTPYRVRFYEKLAARPGIQLLVVHGTAKKEDGRLSVQASNEWRFSHLHVQNHEWPVGSLTLRWSSGACRAVRRFDPDTVVIHGVSGNAANWLIAAWARYRKRRLLVWFCGWEAQHTRRFAYRIKHPLLRIFFRLADHVLPYGTAAAAYAARLGVPRERITPCYNGIDIDAWLESEAGSLETAARLRRESQNENACIVLYVGALMTEKRVDLLLDAFARLPRKDAVLWIVGDGPDSARLRKRADELQTGRIQFFGRVVEGVAPYFAAADLFVLPGTGGLALNQAMYWRTPCICSHADGTEDDLVIEGGTGYRFKADDAEDLSAVLLRAIEDLDSPHRAAMGDRARALILTRSNVTEMVRTFESVLKGRV